MEQLRVGICEDDKESRVRLLGMVTESADKVTAEAFESAEELLDHFYPGKFDLLILDIYMNKMTGIDALERIRKKDTRVVAAIATTSQDFALESYRLRAARYLEKPVKQDDIRDLIQDVIHKKESEPHFEGESGGERIRVPFDCILFAEQRGKSICLHMDDGQELVFRGRLDDEMSKFPEKYYFRCHKSFLVNLSKICSIDRELLTFVMQDGEQVHIHRQGFFAAKRAYEHFLFSIAEGWKEEGQEADE
ncbi:MAG: LytR/AlgR family response regulator transcription factor [Bilifractor sp.]